METAAFNVDELRDLFTTIGLANPGGLLYDQRLRKHRQVFRYLEQVQAALRKLSTKREIVFLDCGCGRSYLSFVVNRQASEEMKRNVYFVGVDTNEELVDRCRKAAESLELDNMEFHCADIIDFEPGRKVDIVYSLHACDTGTDQTVAKGALLQASRIFSVSCCQHRNRKMLKPGGLACLTRFRDYKERLTDMVGDALRALLLESLGHKVKIFEFCPSSDTPKNIMLRATRCGLSEKRTEQALLQYKEMVKRFGVRPAAEEYLAPLLAAASETYENQVKGRRVFD